MQGSGDDCMFEDSNLEIVQTPRALHLRSEAGEQWFKVTTLATLYEILQKFAYSKVNYRLVAGNTGTGISSYELKLS